jgi:hypothetical protein
MIRRRDLPPDIAAAVSDLDKAKQKLSHAVYRHGRLFTDQEQVTLDQAKALITDVMAALRCPDGAA